ncbi:MAG: hypothetical protein HY321_02110 [Armatimonadetes bacterium]|nr:hypothetical protein [Armatimonadota bacterium]
MARLPEARLDLKRRAGGFTLGVLLASGAQITGLLPRALECSPLILPAAGAAGALLAPTRARVLLWALGAVEALLLMVAVYAPVAPAITHALVRQDDPGPADAVVVLLSDVPPDASFPAEVRFRALHACQPLRAGHARRMVLVHRPGPWGSQIGTARRQLRLLAGDYPVEETPPAASTRDEVRAVCRLARARGWSRVFLVCRPTATRRAADLFEAAGLRVLCLPAGSTAPPALRRDCVFMLSEWVREGAALIVLRLQGVRPAPPGPADPPPPGGAGRRVVRGARK